MGSSKKHKEKRDKKKHKKGRSRSRERDHKKSHKSSHRKEKRRSPDISDIELQDEKKQRYNESDNVEHGSPATEVHETVKSIVRHRDSTPEDEFDIDKLLDSKLVENKESSSKRASKKRRREVAIEELRKRSRLDINEDSLEKFAEDQFLEEHGLSSEVIKKSRASVDTSTEIPYLGEKKIKEESPDSYKASEDYSDRQSLSISEANKLRAKLGLRPLDVGKEKSTTIDQSAVEVHKLRSKLGLKTKESHEQSPGTSNSSIIETSKSRIKSSVKTLEETNCSKIPDDSDIIETNKLRSKLGLKTVEEPSDPASEFSEPQLSLSISETNKLRAKLGLKPLDVGSEIPGLDESDEKEISKPAAEVFVKTENIREKQKTEALREKLRVIKEKRSIEEKLRKTKGIADSDSEEESAASWVMKHQKMLQEKEAAEKRAKLLEEMDEEFGIGALVEEEFDKKKAYTAQNLKGLTIGHDINTFQEGHDVILTLKDKGVLEEEEDVLVNVNFVDSEKYAKNVENKKKKPDYKPYEEPEYDEFGILKKKNLLSKYDEEIDGEKRKAFKIGTMNNTPYVSKEQELELIRMKLKQQNEMSLEMPELKVANEYFTTEDMVQFKKPKKKKKIRKTPLLKADDLLSDVIEGGEKDFGSRKNRRKKELDPEDLEGLEQSESSGIPLIDQADETVADLSKVVIDEDTAEKELSSALHKAKKLKQRKIMATAPEQVIEILNSVNGSGMDSKNTDKGGNIEMNSVAEFCRTLGEIPTYGMSGNRDEEAEDLMDLERELLEERSKQDIDSQNQGAWNEVDIEEKPAEISIRDNEPILEEEPDISLGIAGALNLATKKGYLDKADQKVSSAPRSSQLQAQSYTIEEKFYEDDKFGKRDRYTGPVQDFKEKNNYKPDVKLEYIDDSGRLLTPKEAFRYLSHKFHGKGPGKNKVDKRMKKLDQDTRLKQMSSTDTPLNTVKLLQLKQKETQSPYIVLSGGNKTLTQTMISKTKQP